MKRKEEIKTKLSQLEKQFSELAKDVSELRQTIAKNVEVVEEEIIKEEEIDFSVPQLMIGFNDDEKHLGSIIMSNGKHDFNNFEGYVVKIYGGKNNNFFAGQFCDTLGKKFFKKFKGELTIK